MIMKTHCDVCCRYFYIKLHLFVPSAESSSARAAHVNDLWLIQKLFDCMC